LYGAVGSGTECGSALVKENMADRRRTREEEGILNRLISIVADGDDGNTKSNSKEHRIQEAET
jgi:hypothetical protein